jgi:hypothetical protein
VQAVAVIGMVERRAGVDLFDKHVKTLVAAAAQGSGARMVEALPFLTEISRWVHLTAG